MAGKNQFSSLTDLPNDVFIIVFRSSSLRSLYCLSLTCKALHDLVESIGWSTHQRVREEQSLSWLPACLDDAPGWTPRVRLRYNAVAARNIRHGTFVEQHLASDDWRFGSRGQLFALGHARTRLVVGAGCVLNVHRFEACAWSNGAPRMRLEGTYIISAPKQGWSDATIKCLAFLPNGDGDRTLLAGFRDGYVMRITLPEYSASVGADVKVKEEVLYKHGVWETVVSISVSDNIVFSLSWGSGMLSTFSSESDLVSSIAVRPRLVTYITGNLASLLLPSAPGGPHVVIGSDSDAPLSLHAILEGSCELSARPTAHLGLPNGELVPRKKGDLPALNALAPAPPAFPGAHSGAVVVSSWKDGVVRLYDVRTPPAGHYSVLMGARRVPVLAPVITLTGSTPEHAEAMATGGPFGATVAVGGQNVGWHECLDAAVGFWDVRNPLSAVSAEAVGTPGEEGEGMYLSGQLGVYAPKKDEGPVCALALAGAHCFGVTKRGAFALDFGGSVARNAWHSHNFF